MRTVSSNITIHRGIKKCKNKKSWIERKVDIDRLAKYLEEREKEMIERLKYE